MSGWTAGQQLDLRFSEAGDEREHPIPCQHRCGDNTGNWRGVCTRCVYATNPAYRAAIAHHNVTTAAANVDAAETLTAMAAQFEEETS